MKFKYIGSKPTARTLSHEFIRDIPIEVSEMAAKKLINNRFFQLVLEEAPAKPKRTRKKVINDK